MHFFGLVVCRRVRYIDQFRCKLVDRCWVGGTIYLPHCSHLFYSLEIHRCLLQEPTPTPPAAPAPLAPASPAGRRGSMLSEVTEGTDDEQLETERISNDKRFYRYFIL